MHSVSWLLEQLYAKDNALASQSLRKLEEKSVQTSEVYACLPQVAMMLDHRSARVRMRAIALMAVNARWDEENQLTELMPRYLAHITDEKPTVARQCIRCLPEIIRCKPHLGSMAVVTLKQADVSGYPASMRALIAGDIDSVLQQLVNDQAQ